ncbi:MAG: formate/nitrite transporter family protein [Planctomycetaceae bacterium]
MDQEHSLDALLPPKMAEKAEKVGVAKAEMPTLKLFVLAVLAGAFIALGANFATIVATETSGSWPYGVTRLLVGTVFSLGLVLVIVGGAELFTGNNLIVMAWANRKVSTQKLLRNWGIVYAGNFVGALGTAGLVYFSGQADFAGGKVGETAAKIAVGKVQLDWVSAIALGILCNTLVCLAVWLTFSARTTADRILSIVPPIAAFVAAGFEHCVANMYFIPLGLFLLQGGDVALATSSADAVPLTWSTFFARNLIPVTIGNIVGGAVLVGVVYWFVYLRTKPE